MLIGWASVMRLNKRHCVTINNIIKQRLESKSEVWLFGSRVDDSKRGGDIDLYISTEKNCGLNEKLRLVTKIQLAVGIRKVDLIVNYAGSMHKAIFDTAK
jgi:uncharacterized protein